MAKPKEQITLGVDVSKDSLDIAFDCGKVVHIANTDEAINEFLDQLDAPLAVALEPTGGYQNRLISSLLDRSDLVYQVKTDQLVHYRKAIDLHSKNDKLDAQLLNRFMRHEQHELTPLTARKAGISQLRALAHRRAAVVNTSTAMRQSFSGDSEIFKACQKIQDDATQQILAIIDREMMDLIKTNGMYEDLKRCMSIPGIGRLNAIALTTQYYCGDFSNVDKYIAFAGMDITERKSGTLRGRERLSKKGDGEVRRLIYNAAMSASRHPEFKAYYQSRLNRDPAKPKALIALARKLMRIAFALLKNGTLFQPNYASGVA